MSAPNPITNWRREQRLVAASQALLAACKHAEAVLTIVEPRSHKREYLETLAEIRTAIAKAEDVADRADGVTP